jgi:hypothetical protein
VATSLARCSSESSSLTLFLSPAATQILKPRVAPSRTSFAWICNDVLISARGSAAGVSVEKSGRV